MKVMCLNIKVFRIPSKNKALSKLVKIESRDIILLQETTGIMKKITGLLKYCLKN